MSPLASSPAVLPRLVRLRRALAGLAPALPLLAVPALLASTSDEVAVPPRVPVLLAAVLVFAALAGRGGPRPRPWLDLPLAAVLGLAAGHILLAPGLPRAHDTITHLWGIAAVAREVAAGELLPRWVHGLGLGIPLLQFYGPGSFLAPLALSLAGAGPAAALSGGLAILGALAAISMYVAAARWTGDRRAALVAAAAYAFAPYRLLDSHYRAALGECAGLALLPLVFVFCLEAARQGGGRRLAAAAVTWALALVTHPLSALLAALGLLLWMGVEQLTSPGGEAAGLHSGRRPAPSLPGNSGSSAQRTGHHWPSLAGRALVRGLMRLAGVWALGAALAAFFVVPFAVELRNVEVAGVARGEQRQLFVAHGLAPRELWQRRLWSRLYLSEHAGTAAATSGEEMPFYLGLVLLSLAPLAALRRSPETAARHALPPAAAGGPPPRAPFGLLALLAVALALSLRPVAAAVSPVAPPLAVLQFPWRFLGLATFAAAAAAGFAAAHLLARWRHRRWLAALVPGALAALLILDAAPYTGAAEWLPPYAGLVRIRWPAGRPWHPEGRARLEPVAPPYPARVAGYFLPPPEPGAAVSLFCCAYPEYVTPAVRQAFFPPRDRSVLARAGVGLAAWETGPLERLRPRPYAFWRPAGGGRLRPRPAHRARGEITVALDGRPGTLVVLEQDYPGWRVWTPEGWRDIQPTRAGLLQTAAAAGQREARFRFGGTWDRTAGALLSAVTLVGLIAAHLRPDTGSSRRSAGRFARGER